MDNLDFAEAAVRAKTVGELTASFSGFLGGFGLDRFMGAIFAGQQTTQKEKDLGFVVNYPPEWFAHYLARHYVDHDPVYLRALHSREPFTWAEVIAAKPGPLGVQVMNEAREFGLIGGIGVTMTQSSGTRVGLGISSSLPGARMDRPALLRIQLAAFSFFTAYYDLSGATQSPSFRLSPRECEILTWIAAGKTKAETADLLGIGGSCVKRHCENSFLKLGANSLAHAVAKAMHLGLIQPF